MADNPTLHADTVAWFDKWKAHQESVAKAFNDLTPGNMGIGNVGQRPNQSCNTFAAEIGQNESFAAVSTDPYGDSETEGDFGFPKADTLINDYLAQSKTTKSMEPLVQLQRQLNILESFRKKRLSEKQTKAELLQHVQVMKNQCIALMLEYERLMLLLPYQDKPKETA